MSSHGGSPDRPVDLGPEWQFFESNVQDGSGLVFKAEPHENIDGYPPPPPIPEWLNLRNKLTGAVTRHHRQDVKEILGHPGTIYEPAPEPTGA